MCLCVSNYSSAVGVDLSLCLCVPFHTSVCSNTLVAGSFGPLLEINSISVVTHQLVYLILGLDLTAVYLRMHMSEF